MQRLFDPHHKPVILIVDDDNTVIMALHKTLSTIARVRFANSGVQALQMLNDDVPALLLLDIELPDVSGLCLCMQLRAVHETAELPVLFITSHTDPAMEEKVFDVGGTDFISKPLNPRVVLARVQTHLAYRKALQILSDQAYLDGLTGIDNRRSFDEQFNSEFRRAKRQNKPMSLMLMDIDEFKKYNDHFGHQAGDECLKQLASMLKSSLKRPADFVARYGGEEFAVVLPYTDEVGAEAVAKELLTAIESLKIEHAPNASHPHVTISIGYSTLPAATEQANEISEETLLQTADQGLYQAKAKGRNKAVGMRQ